jgi:hypothetical protein
VSARGRDQRGQSVNIFVVGVLGAMILTAGLVIDGGQKMTAASRAETTAAAAARIGANAAATQQLAGREPDGVALRAARSYLAAVPDVDGSVVLESGALTVETTSTVDTIFLGMVGITEVTGTGRATASIVPTGRQR